MATANHVLLRRITTSVNTSTITFDSIPQTGYTDLKLVISARSTIGGGTNWDAICYRFNGITSGYVARTIVGTGSSAYSAILTTATSSVGGTWGRLMDYGLTTSNQTADTYASVELMIPGYTASKHKCFTVNYSTENNSSTAYSEIVSGRWADTQAISNIDLSLMSGNFAVGSSFALYGIADTNTTPTAAPKADGGDIIKTDGTYWYHAFLASGSFKPQLALSADVLVVAGGGGGGQQSGGGGGAGGLLAFTSQSLSSASTYTCTVGAGGAGSTTTSRGTNGGDSQFGALTLVVGGGGGGTQGGTNTGATGGSGGGGSYSSGAGGSATSGQGYAGGTGSSSGGDGGGGGGAGAAGANALNSSPYTPGVGGVGLNTWSSWATATGTGSSGYYAAGGGGGSNGTAGPSAGGTGGGGTGANTTNTATSAIANTGSGGGGGCDVGTRPTGGTGGSGIIIIRYPV